VKIAGCVALVTGTNRGIGRQIVEELCARGASRVYAAMRDLAGAPALPPAAEPLRLDITVADTVARVASEHPDVTLLVNNAGVCQFGELLAPGAIDVLQRSPRPAPSARCGSCRRSRRCRLATGAAP